MMLRRYFVANETFGTVCFNGRRFFTAQGALRHMSKKIPPNLAHMFDYSVRRFL